MKINPYDIHSRRHNKKVRWEGNIRVYRHINVWDITGRIGRDEIINMSGNNSDRQSIE